MCKMLEDYGMQGAATCMKNRQRRDMTAVHLIQCTASCFVDGNLHGWHSRVVKNRDMGNGR